MNNLTKIFPDATKKDRVIPVKYYGPNDPESTKEHRVYILSAILVAFGHAISIIVLLFVLGIVDALKEWV
jgi:hypothetical protein